MQLQGKHSCLSHSLPNAGSDEQVLQFAYWKEGEEDKISAILIRCLTLDTGVYKNNLETLPILEENYLCYDQNHLKNKI